MKGSLELLGATHDLQLLNQQLTLDASKAFYWHEERALVLADVHLGKAGHFRKHGVPIPRQVHISDLQRVNSLISRYQPAKVLFLGDLFHSDSNEEWLDFVEWSNFQKGVEQVLIEGNHDILEPDSYRQTRMILMDRYESGPFSLTHEQEETEAYNISGHVHPCVYLRGLARQGARLSCFHFGVQYGMIPAFGEFTGNHPIRPKKSDLIFAIGEGQLIGLMG